MNQSNYKDLFYQDAPIDSRELLMGLLLVSQELQFDGYSCDEYTEVIEINTYATINLHTLEWKAISTKADWEELYAKFKGCRKLEVPAKIWVWRQLNNATPYEELTAKSQMRRDKYNRCYPQVNSKYFKDIPIAEIKQIIEDIQMDLGSNINDWTMYRDNIPEHWVRSQQNRIAELKKHITL